SGLVVFGDDLAASPDGAGGADDHPPEQHDARAARDGPIVDPLGASHGRLLFGKLASRYGHSPPTPNRAVWADLVRAHPVAVRPLRAPKASRNCAGVMPT